MSPGGRGGPPKIAPNCAAAGSATTPGSAATAMSSSLCRTIKTPGDSAAGDCTPDRGSGWLTRGIRRAKGGRGTRNRSPAVERTPVSGRLPPARHPCLVIACRLRPAALRKRRAARALRRRRAGHVRPVRFLPAMRAVLLLGRRRIHGVMHPPMPRRADLRGFGIIAVDHPAPFEAERWIDLAALGTIIAIAEFILADELAIQRSPHLCAEGLAVPPGEDACEEGLDFHAFAEG